MVKYSEAEVKDRLTHHPEWTEVGGEIQRTYEFADFRASMRFVNEVAEQAERAQHHPDILIRYARVTLTVSTHDAGGITAKDFDLATAADQAAEAISASA
ncbi:MAG: 4a-hydroxytetrahydrobiopterin dehydratase [Phycisphaeraceae bacterium]|nr:4a-hydroxytetrahydrobiopterin dehydratase [Phycisphaeraceae bacterium]